MHALARCIPFTVLVAATAVAQQQVWNRGAVLEPRSGHVMAWDDDRRVGVMFGGFQTARYDETWEWDGVAWTLRLPAVRPVGRRDAAMAHDSLRHRIVMFGGNAATGGLADTWEWDGAVWTQKSPAASPSPRDGAQMAFDPMRGVTVLYGGQGAMAFGDTWTWNGTTWTQLAPAATPGPRELGAMSWDRLRQVMVLFGGTTGIANQNDTWEWNGTTWTQVVTSVSPPIRQRHGLAFDSARACTVLFGGSAGATRYNDVWEYDGVTWVAVPTPAIAPLVRDRIGLAYDPVRARTVLFGGRGPNNTTNQADTWEWDGATWVLRTVTTQPAARTAAAIARDGSANGGVLLFGGQGASSKLQDTWNWDGGRWLARTPATPPPARSGHSLAWDSGRGRTVLFGGLDATDTGLDDTWEWNGSGWVLMATALPPPARSGHALAYDAAHGTTVLFGGLFGFSPLALNDTWEWNGFAWTLRFPANSPPPRTGHALAYDAGRSRVVLFGGATVSPTTALGDTWEWDGTDWTQFTPANAPTARSRHTLSHDPVRGRTLLFGGVDGGGVQRNDSWEWDGTNWTQTATGGPAPRATAATAFDPIRARHVMFGGTVGVVANSETWEYAAIDAADVVPFGTGCPGTFGVPTLSSNSAPALGNNTFAMSLAGLVPVSLNLLAVGFERAHQDFGGCVLNATAAAVLLGGVADGAGVSIYPLAIPPTPTLLGVRLFAQGAGIDAGGALLGFLSLSRALDVRVGS